MTESQKAPFLLPAIGIDVVEKGVASKKGSFRCEIGDQVEFSTARLETYCFAKWEPIVYDALLVAAAVEIGDRTLRRAAMRWERNLEVTVPVHEPDRWNDKSVTNALHSALDFLTGDRWQVNFRKRRKRVEPPAQGQLSLPEGLTAVIPFSDGLDSRIVAGLMARELGDKLIRVRAGARDFVESSARSRGFKFALLSGIAAYLAKAGHIIVPESGQGALGPALVTVGQAYEDYRSHPLFTDRMEEFLAALFGHQVGFQFPRLWHTKGETLAKFIKESEGGSGWQDTWSCWQQTRQVSVDQKKRQCGICAACMLRRMSVDAAGLTEPKHTYVWENLASTRFDDGVASSFPRKKITGKLRQYAIAGALHLDHLAGLPSSSANAHTLNLTAYQLGKSLKMPEGDIRRKIVRMLTQHGKEWKKFTTGLGQNSFIADWAIHAS